MQGGVGSRFGSNFQHPRLRSLVLLRRNHHRSMSTASSSSTAAAAAAAAGSEGGSAKPPRIVRTPAEVKELRRSLDAATRRPSVGFVPTMGALHRGHLNLMERARAENDVLIISIFVNPTQFGPSEDFDRYPRTLERDVELAERVGVDYVFAPRVDDMYGASHRCYVVPEGFDVLAEGRQRPGHFRGVATIVTKLFGIVQPTRAYFGQKDAMQCVLIKRMVKDLHLAPEVVICPTIREADGLAMSSRNAYLDPKERTAASIIYAGLRAAQERYEQAVSSKELVQASELRAVVCDVLAKEPLIRTVEYVSVASKDTMEEVEGEVTVLGGAVLSLALRLGKVRLIDNVLL